MRTTLTWCVVASLLGLAACGLRGPLVRAGTERPASAASATPP